MEEGSKFLSLVPSHFSCFWNPMYDLVCSLPFRKGLELSVIHTLVRMAILGAWSPWAEVPALWG